MINWTYLISKNIGLLQAIFPNYIWKIPNKNKIVYLTFDDGPTPEVTEWVLDELKKNDLKATFFCIGDNIRKNPTIFKKIINDKHCIGNHTFNHLNGWKTNNEEYLKNVELCQLEMSNFEYKTSNLFRPPYGKIKSSQANTLLKKGYKIIMWDVISGDYDQNLTPQNCLNNVLNNLTTGSIIVFHDSEKAFKNLSYILPKTLNFLKENNFQCEILSV